MKRQLPLALAVVAALLPWPLDAALNSTFQVSASIVAGCLVVGGASNLGNLNFGSYSALSSSTPTAALTTTVTLQCTPGVALSMAINGGQNNNGARNLKRSTGAQLLAYQLYLDAGFSQTLGIGQTVSVTYSNPAAITLPVYARTQLTGTLPADSYTDVLQVTLSW